MKLGQLKLKTCKHNKKKNQMPDLNSKQISSGHTNAKYCETFTGEI